MLKAKNILIISHKNPDADSVGANLALREALENIGKTVDSACIDPPPQDSRFLRKIDSYLSNFETSNYDLVISVDCGGYKLVGFQDDKPELLNGKTEFINIDHHTSNDHFGTVNIVMDNTPATCFILFLMFTTYGWDITSSMATALLHGLYYDTGSFMHSNTNADVLRIASRLKALGADHQMCVKYQFKTSSLQRLRLWGRALERAQMNDKKAIVSAITKSDYQATESTQEDLSGLISYLNHVPEAKFCMLLTEDGKGNVKGSLRTQHEEIDLAEIASLFGGGGHKKAAGFTIPGQIKEKRVWNIE